MVVCRYSNLVILHRNHTFDLHNRCEKTQETVLLHICVLRVSIYALRFTLIRTNEPDQRT